MPYSQTRPDSAHWPNSVFILRQKAAIPYRRAAKYGESIARGASERLITRRADIGTMLASYR